MSKKPEGRILEVEAIDNRVYAVIEFKHPITGELVTGEFRLTCWGRAPAADTTDCHRRLMNPIVGISEKQHPPNQS
tara:strand:+ start:113 stop:340 length:228 start_codon:yes stop_codon:yes gene_type:complete